MKSRGVCLGFSFYFLTGGNSANTQCPIYYLRAYYKEYTSASATATTPTRANSVLLGTTWIDGGSSTGGQFMISLPFQSYSTRFYRVYWELSSPLNTQKDIVYSATTGAFSGSSTTSQVTISSFSPILSSENTNLARYNDYLKVDVRDLKSNPITYDSINRYLIESNENPTYSGDKAIRYAWSTASGSLSDKCISRANFRQYTPSLWQDPASTYYPPFCPTEYVNTTRGNYSSNIFSIKRWPSPGNNNYSTFTVYFGIKAGSSTVSAATNQVCMVLCNSNSRLSYNTILIYDATLSTSSYASYTANLSIPKAYSATTLSGKTFYRTQLTAPDGVKYWSSWRSGRTYSPKYSSSTSISPSVTILTPLQKDVIINLIYAGNLSGTCKFDLCIDNYDQLLRKGYTFSYPTPYSSNTVTCNGSSTYTIFNNISWSTYSGDSTTMKISIFSDAFPGGSAVAYIGTATTTCIIDLEDEWGNYVLDQTENERFTKRIYIHRTGSYTMDGTYSMSVQIRNRKTADLLYSNVFYMEPVAYNYVFEIALDFDNGSGGIPLGVNIDGTLRTTLTANTKSDHLGYYYYDGNSNLAVPDYLLMDDFSQESDYEDPDEWAAEYGITSPSDLVEYYRDDGDMFKLLQATRCNLWKNTGRNLGSGYILYQKYCYEDGQFPSLVDGEYGGEIYGVILGHPDGVFNYLRGHSLEYDTKYCPFVGFINEDGDTYVVPQYGQCTIAACIEKNITGHDDMIILAS